MNQRHFLPTATMVALAVGVIPSFKGKVTAKDAKIANGDEAYVLQIFASAPIEYRIPPATTKATVPPTAWTAAQSTSETTHTAGTAVIGHGTRNGHRHAATASLS